MKNTTYSTQSIPAPALTVTIKEFELRKSLDLKDSQIDKLTNELAMLKELIQQFRDEIAILKGQNPKPKIAPSLLEGSKKKSLIGTRDFNAISR